MKKIMLLLTMLLFYQTAALAQEEENITSTDGYILVWHDEFNTEGAPNPLDWNFEEGFVRNEELQWYQPQNAICRNGVLTLTARKENRPNPNYNSKSHEWGKLRKNIYLSSASITTAGKHEFLYGRFEVRARFHGTPGTWPSVWLLGTKYPWPSGGEIDMLSFFRYHGIPSILTSVCWAGENDESELDISSRPLADFLAKDSLWTQKFHVWRLDWEPSSIRIYLDNELLSETSLTETINAPSSTGANDNPFETPMFLLLNLAMGSNGGFFYQDTLPTSFDIDYVRVFQKL